MNNHRYSGFKASAASISPIKASANGHYFVDQNNQPFFYYADTAWAMIEKLTKTETEQYLENRRLKGFSVIQMWILPVPFGSNTNRDGQYPFNDFNHADSTQPNDLYFQHVD